MKNRIKNFFPSLTFSSFHSHLPLPYLLLPFLTLFAVSVASAQIPSSGLVGYWPFNGNANDESGNGNNGTVNGATLTTDRFGNANSAYSFDGVNDWIGMNFQNINTSYSLSFWYYSAAVTNGMNFLESNSSYCEPINQANIYYNQNTSGGNTSITSVGSFQTGIWSNVLISFDGINNLQSIYINGVLDAQQSVTSTLNPLNSLLLAKRQNNTGYYNGKLDDISIYNRALTPAEITQIYTSQTSIVQAPCTPFLGEDQTVCAGTSVTLSASGSSLACPTLPSTLQNGLVGYWPFCGNANDASGNGHNGTLIGATLATDRFGNPNSAASAFNVGDMVLLNGVYLNDVTNYTVSLWYKKSAGSAGAGGLYCSSNIYSTNGLRLGLGSNEIAWGAEYMAGGVWSYSNQYSYFDSQWHLLTGVLESTAGQNLSSNNLKVYLDGVLQSVYQLNWGNPAVVTSPVNNGNIVSVLGNESWGNQLSFGGLFDDATIHNRALSASEVQQLYTLGQSTYLWSTGATTATINVTPTTTTTYTCTVTDANGNVCTDSVTVFVPQIEATDLTICTGETTTLSVSGINSTATPSACPTLTANLQTGLVGYWPFCGNANDASGNGNNGTVNGATLTTDRFGNASSAYSFDGVDDGVQVAISSIPVGSSPRSLSTWIYTSLSGNNFNYSHPHLSTVAAYGNPAGGPVIFPQFIKNLTGNLYVETGSSQNEIYSTQAINNAQWHNVITTYDGSFVKMYVDGVLNATSNSVSLATAYSNLGIGVCPWAPIHFEGKIDDVMLFNRALSDTEIQNYYQNYQNFVSHVWSNGATTPTINVSPTSTTTYTCTVMTNGVSCTDSVTVVVSNPVIDLGADVTVCGTSTTLTAPSGYDSYLWSNGGTANTTTVSANGTYSCTVTQGGCSATDAIDVTLIDATITASDSIVCAGETVNLGVMNCPSLSGGLDNGLVGFWPFCGNANDESGNNFDGVVAAANLTADRFGSQNSAYQLNGANSQISTPFLGILGGNSRTISFWADVDPFVSELTVIQYGSSSSANGGSDRFGCKFANNGTPSVGIDIDGSQVTYAFPNLFNGWHLFTYTFSSSDVNSINNVRIYADGNLLTTLTQNYIPFPAAGVLNTTADLPLTFGGNQYNNVYYNGFLDDVAVYNRALSTSEIQELYTLNSSSFEWSNGATTPTINVSPTSTTTYTCTVTTNGVSCTDTVTVVVSQPVASITPNGIVEICEGESIALTANGGTSYLWNTGAPTQSITVNTEAFYTVTVTDENGCTDTESQLVKVNLLPNIGVNNASICPGQSTTLTATGGLSYEWSPATGLSSTTGTTVTASPSTSTVYTVTGTGANGCTNTATAAVAVNALPAATITPATATTFCQGGGVVLNANTGAGLSYQWFNNTVAISGETSSTYIANTSGSYTVIVTSTTTCSSTSNSIDVTTVANVNYFADADGDGFGDPATLVSTCIQPQGYVTDNTDCDDNDSNVNTAATEVCNHIDDDCSGTIDDGLVFETYYADNDSDTYGDANNSIYECSQPSGYVTNNTDCNDNNANQNAASSEICNGEDDDCDGAIDNGLIFLDFYSDIDGDGFGAGDVISSCTDLGSGYTTNNTDCDDTNSGIYPGAEELCNSIDDNCDGQTDDGTLTVYFIDNDGDTYGNPSVSILACVQPIGYTPDDDDCNDTDANINPGAEDIGGNGIDENCDGQIDNSIYELNSTIALYPNPTHSELNIQINSSVIGSDLYIFDAVGKLVRKQQLLSTQTTIPVSNFADGNYIVRVGEVVKRFVVEK